MDPAAKAAYIQANAASALIEALGMMSHNMHMNQIGSSSMYSEQAFQDLILKYQIGINDVISFLQS